MVDRFQKQGGSLLDLEVALTHLIALSKKVRDRKEKGICTDYERFSLLALSCTIKCNNNDSIANVFMFK